MSKGLQFGIAYTYSKALGIASADFDSMSPYFPLRERNYGPLSFNIPHMLVINYSYQIPSLGRALDSEPLHWILGGWQLSGNTSFVSGTPFTPSFSTVDSVDITGSNEGARINITGDPYLPKGERTFERNFRTEVFARPAVRDFGNAGVNKMQGPAINNWDVTLSKRIPLGIGEGRYFQFRTEFYNTFNHTQFSSVDSSARFDAAGNQVDANFGVFTGARDPRRIQFSVRLMF